MPTITVPMATKLGRRITYLDGLLPKSHMTLWSPDLSRSHEKVKPLYLHYWSSCSYQTWWDDNLPWWARTHKVTWMTLRLHGLVRSCDSLRSLYIYHHSAYGHQTCQACDLPGEASTHVVTQTFGHVVMRDHVTN